MGFAAPKLVAAGRPQRAPAGRADAAAGAAECLQWRLRRQPLGLEDWRAIAGEDTGSMFEICAALGMP